MKKFLSLVLALVMTMSLVTVSAGAKDFTDNSKINYKEAVDVLSAVKVIDGYTDGAFNPTNTLTRGAAAKIICNLLLGPTTASALSADAAPYKDVPVNNTFAGYIAYCAKAGIISGYADGTFRPGNSLTGYAFMKMLLGALGYDASIEGYTDANWSIAVAKRALNIGLDNGLKEDFNGVKAVNREEACLYAFNMLQADLVEYDKKSTIKVGDITITDNSNAQSKTWGSSATRKDNIKADQYVQFAEEYFNKLVKDKDTNADDFGRPATKWTYKGEKIGTYANDADKTYVGSVNLNAIYADLNMSSKCAAKDTKVYINGNEYTGKENIEVSKSNDTKLSKIADSQANTKDKVGDGTLVEVYRDDDTNDVTIVAISVYSGTISNVKNATSKKDAYVVVEPSSNYPATIGKDDNDEFETENFSEDDVVAYTYAEGDVNEIKTMYKLESTTGELAKRTVGKNLTLGDTTYKYAKNVGFDTTTMSNEENDLKNKNEYNIYLDANGFVLYVEEASFSVSSYALVEKISDEDAITFNGSKTYALELDTTTCEAKAVAGGSSTWDGNKAKLLFSDGTEKTVSLSDNFMSKKGIKAGDIVRYSTTDDGYKLTAINSKNLDRATDFKIEKKTISGSLNASGDSKTIFVVDKNDDYKVYTGIKNAPNVKSGVAIAYVKDDVIQVVFVVKGTVENSSKDITFVAAPSASKRVTASDLQDYYQYNAVVKGEITTVMIKADSTDIDYKGGTFAPGASEVTDSFIFNNSTSDGDDVIETTNFTGTDVTSAVKHGVKKISADEIKLGTFGGAKGSTLSVASSVKVYLVDTDGNIEAITMSDVKTNSSNYAYFTMEDGEITNLFIQEVDD